MTPIELQSDVRLNPSSSEILLMHFRLTKSSKEKAKHKRQQQQQQQKAKAYKHTKKTLRTL